MNIDIEKLSAKTRDTIRRVLGIIIDSVELYGLNRLTGVVAVPVTKFENEGLCLQDIEASFNRLGSILAVSITNRAHRELGPLLNVWVPGDPSPISTMNEYLKKNVVFSGLDQNEVDKMIELFNKLQNEGIIVGNLNFDTLNRVFIYNGKTYKIQSKIRLELAKKLWEERQEVDIKTGRISRKGEAFPKNALAVHASIIENPKEFNSVKKEKLKGEINAINREFKGKGFPVMIKTVGGVQMVVKINRG